MQTVEQFINDLGGTVAVASALDLTPSTVSSWKAANSIPKWRVASVDAFAKTRGKKFPNAFADIPKPAASQDAAA